MVWMWLGYSYVAVIRVLLDGEEVASNFSLWKFARVQQQCKDWRYYGLKYV